VIDLIKWIKIKEWGIAMGGAKFYDLYFLIVGYLPNI
jgi:hypothetical protein